SVAVQPQDESLPGRECASIAANENLPIRLQSQRTDESVARKACPERGIERAVRIEAKNTAVIGDHKLPILLQRHGNDKVHRSNGSERSVLSPIRIQSDQPGSRVDSKS